MAFGALYSDWLTICETSVDFVNIHDHVRKFNNEVNIIMSQFKHVYSTTRYFNFQNIIHIMSYTVEIKTVFNENVCIDGNF